MNVTTPASPTFPHAFPNYSRGAVAAVGVAGGVLSSHTPQVTAALARITTYTQTKAKLFLTQTRDMAPALERNCTLTSQKPPHFAVCPRTHRGEVVRHIYRHMTLASHALPLTSRTYQRLPLTALDRWSAHRGRLT